MAIYFVIFFCFFCIKKSELVAFFFGGYLPTAPEAGLYSLSTLFLIAILPSQRVSSCLDSYQNCVLNPYG